MLEPYLQAGTRSIESPAITIPQDLEGRSVFGYGRSLLRGYSILPTEELRSIEAPAVSRYGSLQKTRALV